MKIYYQDDHAVILHGDCREILPQIKPSDFWPDLGSKFDLCLTDPPYGLAKKLCGGTWGKKYAGDDYDWDAQACPDMNPMLDAASSVCIWGGNYFILPQSRGWLIWRKPFFPTVSDAELAWTNLDMNMRVFESGRTDGEKKVHPTQKPLDLMQWCIVQMDKGAKRINQAIVDPYCGSGTTALAAKNLNRQCVAIERCEEYCESAARRLQQQVLRFSSQPPQPQPRELAL